MCIGAVAIWLLTGGGCVLTKHETIQAEPSEPSDEECRAQLERILGSSDFAASSRGHRFLRYVVDEERSGRADRIKAYSIAVEVFGRDASFDPQTDPIVRIEAGHLRRSLERYYLTSGLSDPIIITIPKGGYVPTFARRETVQEVIDPDAPASQEAEPGGIAPNRWLKPTWLAVILSAFLGGLSVLAWDLASRAGIGSSGPQIPRVHVEPFTDLSASGTAASIATGLSQEIVGHLSKFKEIIVVEATDNTATPPRFALAGSVNVSTETFRLWVKLTRLKDGTVLWAHRYDGGLKVGELLDAQDDIARNVATSLAQTYGVIYQSDASAKPPNAPEDWTAYSCTLSYYAYRASLDPKLRPGVRDCLERAVERFPGYATAWALLSQTYIDEIRFVYPFEPNRPSVSVERALAAARRATELDPQNTRALQAEMFALYLGGDIDTALAVGRHALELNPNDTELIGEYGYRLAVSGNWVDGCVLVAEARDRNPGPFAYYETALALCAYFAGDYDEAVAWMKKASIEGNAIFHAISAAVFAEAGLDEEARRETDWLELNAPAFVKNAENEAAFRLGSSADVEKILASLKKAGLDFPSRMDVSN